ncbi:10799_t:CDS:2 [Funneliformis geosporum]|uniref:9435_t:CDS:1 n=1 Tax=Funneliformis geosporum TaxID=1117311 RepID=A0A9W4WYP8_9GLOM|nr:9435_t:CDS:2 [Funneliformis geosporum]CAI2189380.1 10799_t:CDS:2 [Funneliformis geosporum]
MFQPFSPQYYQGLEFIANKLNDGNKPLEEYKISTFEESIPIPDNLIVNEVKLDESYRIKSKEYLEVGLKKYEDVVDEKWKEFDDGGLCGEWIKVKDEKEEDGKIKVKGRVALYLFGGGYFTGSSKSSRKHTLLIAEKAECQVFSIDYRLAPEHQFSAPHCDALAAYFYLTNPGPEAGFEPIDPKRIVFVGTSAGGGLAVGTALFLRDSAVDLTNSMPSYWEPGMDKSDMIPGRLCFPPLGPPGPLSIEYLKRVKILSEKIKQKKPKVVGHHSFTKIPRFRLLCANEALAIPYFSPMLAESLGNLPPILCQAGGGERLRDSIILFSYKASDPSKYQVPKYAMENFSESPFKKPTKVTLEVYDEACHCFFLFPTEKISQFALNRSYDFIKLHAADDERIPNELESNAENGKTLNAVSISPNCEVRELDAKYMECLNFEDIGVVPDVNEPDYVDNV